MISMSLSPWVIRCLRPKPTAGLAREAYDLRERMVAVACGSSRGDAEAEFAAAFPLVSAVADKRAGDAETTL